MININIVWYIFYDIICSIVKISFFHHNVHFPSIATIVNAHLSLRNSQ